MIGRRQGVNNNCDQVLLKPEYFLSLARFDDPLDELWMEMFRTSKKRDASVIKALASNDPKFREADGLVFKKAEGGKELSYVPVDKRIREMILKSFHDLPTMGHPGRFKMHEAITRSYMWSGVLID